ncbi:MAG: hypothetical protein WAU88_13690, partial [Candidatus Zixiibacteriota bacterium]
FLCTGYNAKPAPGFNKNFKVGQKKERGRGFSPGPETHAAVKSAVFGARGEGSPFANRTGIVVMFVYL